jgi:hypothetical protein
MNTISAQDAEKLVSEKSNDELLAMLARPDDWQTSMLDAVKAQLQRRNVEFNAAIPQAQQGAEAFPACPKCSQTDIQRPYRWSTFLTFVALLLFGGGLIGKFIELARPPFFLETLCQAVVFFFFCAVILTFFSAMFGKNRCKACGYRWKGKATP